MTADEARELMQFPQEVNKYLSILEQSIRDNASRGEGATQANLSGISSNIDIAAQSILESNGFVAVINDASIYISWN